MFGKLESPSSRCAIGHISPVGPILWAMYTVFIRGLEFYGYHGVPAEERFIGHRYRVDLELRVEGTADESDHVSETVDYGAVATFATQVGTNEKAHTVERLARLIG